MLWRSSRVILGESIYEAILRELELHKPDRHRKGDGSEFKTLGRGEAQEIFYVYRGMCSGSSRYCC